MLITFMNAFPTPLGGGKNKPEGTDGVSVCASPPPYLLVTPCSPLLTHHLSSRLTAFQPSPNLPKLCEAILTYTDVW